MWWQELAALYIAKDEAAASSTRTRQHQSPRSDVAGAAHRATVSTSEATREPEMFRWCCELCDVECASFDDLKLHFDDHAPCLAPNCSFEASRELVIRHFADAHMPAATTATAVETRLVKPTPTASVEHAVPTFVPRRVWRCDVCAKNFELESQLLAHIEQHVVCPAPGCNYSAVKRLVTQHRSARHGFVPPHYECHACGGTGHSIYQCPKKLPRAELAARQQAVGELLGLTRPSGSNSDTAAGIAALLTSLMLTRATSARSKVVSRQSWRCDACDKNFVIKSQHSAHIRQHEKCPEPGCSYSAAKRLVTQHRVARHGFVAPRYECHACGSTGHSIYQCPNKLSRAELVARQQRLSELQQ